MRILVVHPGSSFSVADVHNGWLKALKNLGCQVAYYNLNERLEFYAELRRNGDKLPGEDIVQHAAFGLHGKIWEWWPDLIIVISGFYVLPVTWQILQGRPHKTVVIFTESPYEDDRQLNLVTEAQPDLVILNDPINQTTFERVHDNVHYFGHAYDPDLHHPGHEQRDTDFCFVGTGYPSRSDFFNDVDWSGLDVRFAGHWKNTGRLEDFLIHDKADCYPNVLAANLYRGSKMSANLYRAGDNLYRGGNPIECNQPALAHGWSMGPREVELAACETFFLRESRGEGDDIFPMLPTFSEPGEFSDLLRWWLAHDREREAAAMLARKAIQERTFDANARRLLQLIGA